MAQLAIGLAGAAFGGALLPGFSFLGMTGASLGFSVGSTIGGALLTQDTKIEGPRVEGGSVTTSAYGKTIPRVWGMFPVTGNVIDASPVREIKKKSSSGGKGMPETTTTTYTYFGDIAVALCEGVVNAVLQIRANGQVIYDARPEAKSVRTPWLKFELYSGTKTQQPSPVLEAIHGAGNVPAYRGTTYVVFEDFPFSQFGNNFAVTFEFLVSVSKESDLELSALDITPPDQAFSQYTGGIIEPSTGLLIFPISVINGDQDYSAAAVDPYTRKVVWQSRSDERNNFYSLSLKPKKTGTPFGFVALPNQHEIALVAGQSTQISYFYRIDPMNGALLEVSPAKSTTGSMVRYMVYEWFDTDPDARPFYTRDRGSLNGIDFYYGWDTEAQIIPPDGWFYSGPLVSNGKGQILVSLQNKLHGVPDAQNGFAVLDTAFLSWSGVLGVSSSNIANIVYGYKSWWALDLFESRLLEISGGAGIIQEIDLSGLESLLGPGTVDMAYSLSDNSVYIQGLSTLYIVRVDSPEASVIEVPVSRNSPVSLFHAPTCRAWYGATTDEIAVQSINLCAATGESVSLADIVRDLSTVDSMIGDDEVDVSELEPINVHGFAISTPMARRNAIAALQTGYLFDYVSREGVITAILRGQDPVDTITVDDIGAHIDGGDAPAPWTIARKSSYEMPSQVEVKFIDHQHNYEIGVQHARRQSSTEDNIVRIDVPVALSNDEAAQMASIYLHLLHIESETYRTTAMPSRIDDLQPASVVSALIDNVEYTFRVISGNVIDGRIIEVDGAREVPGAFTSYSVGGAPRMPGGAVATPGTMLLLPLDIPTLRPQDNACGMYMAATSFTQPWPGGIAQRSPDSIAWSTVARFDSDVTMGSALNVASGAQPVGWDVESVLNVRLMSGALESTTRDNPTFFAWGNHGRYEIGAFITAVQVDDGTWHIKDMVRGLYDTGRYISTHELGDWFVVLGDSDLARVSLPIDSIGQTQAYRGVTVGMTDASSITTYVAFDSVGLVPFTPVRLDAQLDDVDWVISWERQDRIYGRRFWDQPNSETSESYLVQILNDVGSPVRSVDVSDKTTWRYLAEDQISDFGSGQTKLSFSVSQVSSVTGAGNAATITVGSDFAYAEKIISDGALHYYRFNDSVGSAITADDAGSMPGSYLGSPSLQSPPLLRTGLCVDLDGVDDGILWDTISKNINWLTSIEIAFEISEFPLSGYRCIWCHENNFSPSSSAYLLIGSDQLLRLILYRSSSIQVLNIAGSPLSVDTPYHAIVNWSNSSSGTCSVYLNGSTYASGSTNNSWQVDTSNSGKMRVGYSAAGGFSRFTGRVDDLSIWQNNQAENQRNDHFLRGGITNA